MLRHYISAHVTEGNVICCSSHVTSPPKDHISIQLVYHMLMRITDPRSFSDVLNQKVACPAVQAVVVYIEGPLLVVPCSDCSRNSTLL